MNFNKDLSLYKTLLLQLLEMYMIVCKNVYYNLYTFSISLSFHTTQWQHKGIKLYEQILFTMIIYLE